MLSSLSSMFTHVKLIISTFVIAVCSGALAQPQTPTAQTRTAGPDGSVLQERYNAAQRNITSVPRQNTDLLSNKVYKPDSQFGLFSCKTGRMVRLLRLLVGLFARCFRSRRDLVLENLALRQQLDVLERKHLQLRLAGSNRIFWVALRRLWPRPAAYLSLQRHKQMEFWRGTGGQVTLRCYKSGSTACGYIYALRPN